MNYAAVVLGIWATIMLFTNWISFRTYEYFVAGTNYYLDIGILFKVIALGILVILAVTWRDVCK
jgi:hypothetical protein